MNLILNIGLAAKATATIAAHVAAQIVVANDFRIERQATIQSDTEPTLVVEVQVFDTPAVAWLKLKQIAIDLDQDCIAAYNPQTGTGALIGPRAAAWGEFSPELFIMPDGQRLAVKALAALARRLVQLRKLARLESAELGFITPHTRCKIDAAAAAAEAFVVIDDARVRSRRSSSPLTKPSSSTS